YGDVTSVRVPADKMEPFGRELLKRIDPAALGLTFRPIRAEQLAAASGSTDFAMLFVGFSFYLIAAAALLVAMLFRLNIEQRARVIGLVASLAVAFFAILWAVWHVGKTEAARLLAGGRYAPADPTRRHAGLLALASSLVCGASGLAMLALGMTGAMAPKNA